MKKFFKKFGSFFKRNTLIKSGFSNKKKKRDLVDIANSFQSFDTMYELLKGGDYSILSRECGSPNYLEIQWMLEYFSEKEEYEKCDFLTKLKLKLPKPSKDQLNKEIEWLKSNT